MSVEHLEHQIRELPPQERLKLAEWFDEHRHELIPAAGAAQEREVTDRLNEAHENPGQLESFEEADVDRLFEEFANGRAQKAPARPH